jgi:hypothetical protein
MKIGKKYNSLTVTGNVSEYKVTAICDCGTEKEHLTDSKIITPKEFQNSPLL